PLKVGSAGFAIPGHRFAVLDQNYQELPTGGVGILAMDSEQSPHTLTKYFQHQMVQLDNPML
ncbi:hypothetical protein IAF33_19025, partial [Acinetobacter baumannii]|uniref:hypothetical protein n=1 Tax=Acinetobacter baumannii TaxID=470 RepID=UPI00165FD779|nr:hypothetical protein [Acinetobacter baumannii]